MYHITWPTETLGAVNVQPVGAVEPLVGVVNVGVALDWLWTLYALIKLMPAVPAAAVGDQTNAELFELFCDDAISLPTV